MKKLIFIFVIWNIIVISTCLNVTLSEKMKRKMKDDDLDKYEEDHSMDNLVKAQIKEYVKEQNWKEDEQIDIKAFKKMFVYIIQKGALKQGDSTLIKRLADKIIEKHGDKIFVKDLEKYFNIEDLTLTFSSLLHPKETDL